MRTVRLILSLALQAGAEVVLLMPFMIALFATIWEPALSLPLWIAIWLGLYAAGYTLHAVWQRLRRGISLLLGVAAVGALVWAAGGSMGETVSLALLWTIAWVRGSLNRLSGWAGSLPSGAMLLSLAGYFIASIVFPIFPQTRSYASWIPVLGIVTLALTLYRGNASVLESETAGSGTDGRSPEVAHETKRRNRMFVLGVLAVVLCIAAIKPIASAVRWLMGTVASGVGAVLSFLRDLFSSGEVVEPPQPEQRPDNGLLTAEPPSELALLLDQILYAIGILLVVVIGLFALYWLSKKLNIWIKRWMEWSSERLTAPTDIGYTDEQEKLADSRDWARKRAQRWKRKLGDFVRKQPGWDDLSDNRARIREAYRRLTLGKIAGGHRYDPAQTPRELGEEWNKRHPLDTKEAGLIDVYQDARYASDAIADEKAKQAKPWFEERERRGQ